MALVIKRATKGALKLRMSVSGPSGAGKTYTLLKIAFGLLGIDVTKLSKEELKKMHADPTYKVRVLVADTESDSARKYSDEFPPFDVVNLNEFPPESYIEVIELGEKNGYEVVILDSLTHEWNGKGGVLEIVDTISKRNNGNSTAGWKVATPRHDALFRKILESRVHVLGAFRAKQQIAVDREASGKVKVTKLGMQAIAREGSEYEFDVTADLQLEGNQLIVNKTRCSALSGAVFSKAGFDLASKLVEWLGTDSAAAEKEKALAEQAEAAKQAAQQLAGDQTGGNAGGGTDTTADAKRKDLLAKVEKIVAGRDDAANTIFRTPPGANKPAWLTAQQTWRELSDKNLEYVITNAAKFDEKLKEQPKPVAAAA